MGRTLGKVVWITGASSGIGEAIARLCHRQGAHVLLSSRDKDSLDRLAAELQAEGGTGSVAVIPLDLGQLDALEGKAKEALSCHGRIDVLVNNGGISVRAKVIDTKLDVDRSVMNVNFMSYVALTHAVLPHMVERGSGYIVNTSSVQGLLSIPFRASYAASKHALHGYFDALRAEVTDCNVHVMNVCPGYVHTNLSLNAVTGNGGRHGKMDPTTEKGYSPDYVANEVLIGLEERVATLVMADLQARVGILLRVLCPLLLSWVMVKRARKLRGAQ